MRRLALFAVLALGSLAAPREAREPAVPAATPEPLGAPHGSERPATARPDETLRQRVSGGRLPADSPRQPPRSTVGVELDGGAPQSTPALITAPLERPYQSGIGTGLVGGWAAFCDPTPGRCQGWGRPALFGAMPGFTFGDESFAARVCTDGSRCVVVTVVSYCQCGDRHGVPTVIDLSPAAMEAIEPDYRRLGIVRVTVEFPVVGPRLTAPPTSTGGQP